MLKLHSRCLLQRTLFARAQATHVAARWGRTLLTLAIETSCDDTSVAILETHDASSPPELYHLSKHAHLYFHQRITANNSAHTGIHPLVAHESHQENLANLVNEAIHHLPKLSKTSNTTPDVITVTRGPGMRSSLNTGIDTAKGLALAWQIPLLAVNHMQAHALTPRLVSALHAPISESKTEPPFEPIPRFPFLTLLVSGGHTLLVHSRALTNHAILASTTDVAIGDAIDKMARVILPPEILQSSGEIMYGRLLERFAFPNGTEEYGYVAPSSRAKEITPTETKWGWSLPVPLGEKGKSRARDFSFAGLESAVRRICESGSKRDGGMSIEERREMSRQSMRVIFEHLAMRVCWALGDLGDSGEKIDTLVVSGGVASNGFLREVLRCWLAQKRFEEVALNAPPVELCTDNAAMIAWCGVEMWQAGWESEINVKGIRKWSIDSGNEGGILGVSGWKKRTVIDKEEKSRCDDEDEMEEAIS